MNDTNNYVEAPDEHLSNQVETPASSALVERPESSNRNRKLIVLGAAIVMIVFVLFLVAYTAFMFGRSQSIVDMVDTISSESSVAPKTNVNEDVEEAPANIGEYYSGWNTFSNENYGYSFKYPSGWRVDREAFADSSDWVSVNPTAQADSSNGDILAIYTYVDGSGCPGVKKKEFNVGGHSIEATACPDDEIYRMSMKHAKTVSANDTGVILAVAAPNIVGIQVDMSRGEDASIQKILESITGLTPVR